MLMDMIREACWRKPFTPFELELNNGRKLWILLRERIALSPTGDNVYVVTLGDRDTARVQ